MKKSNTLKEFLFLLCSAFIFIYPAFYNGFPLVTSDSGTYMGSGLGPYVPFDRPAIYGFFLRHISLKESIWFPIVMQGIISAWLLSQTIKCFIPRFYGYLNRIIIFIVIALVTSLPWFCSQVMADLFSPLSVLCIILLLFAASQTRTERITTIILLVFTSLTHNSHLLVNTLLILSISIFFLTRNTYINSKAIRWRWLITLSLVFSCWIIMPLFNYFIDGKFRHSGSPHLFLVARLAESGMLTDYLNRNCKCADSGTINDTTHYVIISKRSHKALDIAAFDTSDGARLQQWAYVEGPNQKFNIIRLGDNVFRIIPVHSKKALTVPDSSSNIVVQKTISNNRNQSFQLVKGPDQYFSIFNDSTQKAFDVVENSDKDGAGIQMYSSTGAENQLFRIFPVSSWKMCLYKDQIPLTAIDFIWPDNSIFVKTGGWEHSEKEYKAILHGIVFSPRYYSWIIREGITSTFRQLVNFDVGDGIFKYGENSPPGGIISTHYKKDLNTYLTSMQNNYGISFTEVNKRLFNAVLISSVLLLIFLGMNSTNPEKDKLKMFIWVCILAVLINAFVSGALANVLDRLQSRIIWLIPFCAVIIIYEPAMKLIERIRNALK